MTVQYAVILFLAAASLLPCIPVARAAGPDTMTGTESGSSDKTVARVRVTDTGQTTCYDNLHRITCPARGEPFYGQDAEYSINPRQCETKGQEIIADSVTGLIWQQRVEPVQRTWSQALDYASNLSLAGYTDWRLPESRELQSIMNFGQSGRDTAGTKRGPCSFPVPEQASQASCYWSITTREYPSLDALRVCLDTNLVQLRNKEGRNLVRAVRGTPIPPPRFRDNGDGTVTDETTGLTWQQEETRPMTWKKALAYCEELELGGHRDWRLPSIRELMRLINEKRCNPATDSDMFPGCRPAPYWSSTTCSRHPAFAWSVDFADGLEYDGAYKTRRYPVRAVRGGQVEHRHKELVRPGKPTPEAAPNREDIHPFPRTPNSNELLEPYPLDM